MRLPERLTMESPTSSSDGTGGVISGWTEEFQCRAKFLYAFEQCNSFELV